MSIKWLEFGLSAEFSNLSLKYTIMLNIQNKSFDTHNSLI